MDLSALLSSTLHRGIQSAVPLLLAANGELLTERAGLVNIGIEGVMLVGALAAAIAGWYTGSVFVALVAAALAGALVGLLFAAWTVHGARDQIVTGLAINLLALGITGVLFEQMAKTVESRGQSFVTPSLSPLLSIDRAAGAWRHALFAHDALTILAPLFVAATAMALSRTRMGLSLRAVGENPEAAATAGIRVTAMRTAAVVAGAAMAGLAGAYLSIGISSRFQEGMTGGRGFVALALVIFGRWSAPRIAIGALFFGLLDALQMTLQPYLGEAVHTFYPALLALPYLATLIALAGLIGRAHPPAALAQPYRPSR